VLAPRGTPNAVVGPLHEAIARVVKQPEMRERLSTQGYDPLGNSSAEFAAYLRAEVGKWAKVVKDAGMRAD
jgi:tripartite-type tricarboxylate transporter receptor subunit TctC